MSADESPPPECAILTGVERRDSFCNPVPLLRASLSAIEAKSHRKFNAVISSSGLIVASKWFGAGLFGK